jgi:hypothetical protein
MCCFVHPSGLGLRVSQFSPDASQLMTAGDDGLVCLWDIATRSLKRFVPKGLLFLSLSMENFSVPGGNT